jgi:hypothetical protein
MDAHQQFRLHDAHIQLIEMCNHSSVAVVSKQLGVDFSTISGRLKRRNKYNLVVKHTGPYVKR